MPTLIAVIGLGQFGHRLAQRLSEQGAEVLAIDSSRDIVEAVRDKVTHAVALDATDEEALRAAGLADARAAVVSIGQNFEAIALATVLLKQLGVPRVIARAPSPMAERILRRIGADEIVNPEDEAADRWCNRLVAPRFLSQIEFHEGYSLIEVKAPREWIERSLAELNLRAKLGLHVVALKRRRDPENPESPLRIEMPGPTTPLQEGDILVLMGKDEDFARIPQ